MHRLPRVSCATHISATGWQAILIELRLDPEGQEHQLHLLQKGKCNAVERNVLRLVTIISNSPIRRAKPTKKSSLRRAIKLECLVGETFLCGTAINDRVTRGQRSQRSG